MPSRAAVKWLWLDELGNRIPAATVEVFEPGTTTKIAQTIYVDDDPDTSVYPNPFTSDANGIAAFYLADSRRVDLRFSKTGYTTQTIADVDATKPSLGVNVIQDEGTSLTTRDKLNFTGAGVTATDDAANGRTNVTIPGAGAAVGARAYRSTTQALAAATFTKVIFDVEVFDEGADYNPATGEWVCRATGWYDIAARVGFATVADATRVLVELRVNGAVDSRLEDIFVGAASTPIIGGSMPLRLTAGDIVTVYAWRTAAGDIQPGATLTYFTAVSR